MQNELGGPKTEQGKARSSQNALKHGLTSRKLFLLQHENPEQWKQLLADFNEEFQPTSSFENRLVEEIAFAYWRMQRAWVTENALFDSEMDDRAEEFAEKYDQADEGIRQGSAFRSIADGSRSLPLIIRYEARLERAYKRAIKMFEERRATRGGRVNI
jgi:hypothetical protein